MTWFPLPETSAANRAAFSDAKSAAAWVALQPQANAAVMLESLAAQLAAFNVFALPPCERFKTLEVLRKVVFAVSGECQRRFDNKPLPLSSAEQIFLDTTRRLWQACAVGYSHCLLACLDGEESVAPDAAKIAHRAMTSLRMEQLCCYLAGHEVDEKSWRNLHAVYAAGEALDVLSVHVSDPMPRETAESSVSGQYGMALLLHLANPYALTRSQFVAASRWLARWREQAIIQLYPEIKAGACCIALDLHGGGAVHDHALPAREVRWLVLDQVLRKMRKRLEALNAGESPENLKLGNALSGTACIALLETLMRQLRSPSLHQRRQHASLETIEVVPGVDNLYRWLGGKSLNEPARFDSLAGRIKADQLAVFGHVVETRSAEPICVENWLGALYDDGLLDLHREDIDNGARLMLRGMIGVRLAPQDKLSLAWIHRLSARAGAAKMSATLIPGDVYPLVAESQEKATGRVTRQPALRITGVDGALQIVLPAGVTLRSANLSLQDARDHARLAYSLDTLIERTTDIECWSASEASSG